MLRLPVLSLFTLKEQIIAFAGSIHVVIMDIKRKEQNVIIHRFIFIYLNTMRSELD